MKLLNYAVKSMKANKKRSLSFFFFVFIVTVILTAFDSFVITVTDNMKNSMSSILYGDLLIRSDKDTEDIYASGEGWKKKYYVDDSKMDSIYEYCQSSELVKEITPRIRFSGMVSTETNQDTLMVMSLNSSASVYKDYISLVSGHYLTEDDKGSIFLDKDKADTLQVEVGDSVTILIEDQNGQYITKEFKIVGIGNPEMLLSMSIAYIDYSSAEEMLKNAGIAEDSVSDIAIYADKAKNVSKLQEKISSLIKEKDVQDVYVMDSSKAGGFIMGTLDFYVKIFYVFIIILMLIVCILLVNLVIMMGLERRQEIGTLRAIGFKRGQVVRIMLYEIIFVSASACLLGGGMVSLIIYLLRNTVFAIQEPLSYMTGSEFIIHLDVSGLILVLIIVFVLSVLASLFPAVKIASTKPVETLKEV